MPKNVTTVKVSVVDEDDVKYNGAIVYRVSGGPNNTDLDKTLLVKLDAAVATTALPPISKHATLNQLVQTYHEQQKSEFVMKSHCYLYTEDAYRIRQDVILEEQKRLPSQQRPSVGRYYMYACRALCDVAYEDYIKSFNNINNKVMERMQGADEADTDDEGHHEEFHFVLDDAATVS